MGKVCRHGNLIFGRCEKCAEERAAMSETIKAKAPAQGVEAPRKEARECWIVESKRETLVFWDENKAKCDLQFYDADEKAEIIPMREVREGGIEGVPANWLQARKDLAPLSGVPAMAIGWDEHLARIRAKLDKVESLEAEVRNKQLEVEAVHANNEILHDQVAKLRALEGAARLRQGLEEIIRISETAIEENNPAILAKIARKALKDAEGAGSHPTKGEEAPAGNRCEHGVFVLYRCNDCERDARTPLAVPRESPEAPAPGVVEALREMIPPGKPDDYGFDAPMSVGFIKEILRALQPTPQEAKGEPQEVQMPRKYMEFLEENFHQLTFPAGPQEVPTGEDANPEWARKDRERFLGKLVAIRMECNNAVGNAKRKQFDQGAKWLGLRIQKMIREVGEAGAAPRAGGAA